MYFFLHLENKSEYLTTVYHEMCTPFNVSLLQEKGLLGLNCLSLSIWKIYISYKFMKYPYICGVLDNALIHKLNIFVDCMSLNYFDQVLTILLPMLPSLHVLSNSTVVEMRQF